MLPTKVTLNARNSEAKSWFTGQRFYVSSAAAAVGPNGVGGSDTAGPNHGQDPDHPFATAAYAVGLCVAGRGDVVYLMPGHAENIATAGAITVGASGISVVSLGQGALRATFTWTATAGTILHTVTTGVDTTWENVVFNVAGINAVVLGVGVLAAGVTFRNCEWVLSASAKIPAGTALSVGATGHNCTLDNCKLAAGAGITTVWPALHAPVELDSCDNFVMKDSYVDAYGRVATAEQGLVAVVLAAAGAITRAQFLRNEMINRTASCTLAIADTKTGSTGIIDRNTFYVLAGTSPAPGATWFRGANYYSAAAATAGTLY